MPSSTTYYTNRLIRIIHNSCPSTSSIVPPHAHNAMLDCGSAQTCREYNAAGTTAHIFPTCRFLQSHPLLALSKQCQGRRWQM
jgi:hypothetical protein